MTIHTDSEEWLDIDDKQVLSFKDGVIEALLTDLGNHKTNHPAPTNRDDRNAAADHDHDDSYPDLDHDHEIGDVKLLFENTLV